MKVREIDVCLFGRNGRGLKQKEEQKQWRNIRKLHYLCFEVIYTVF